MAEMLLSASPCATPAQVSELVLVGPAAEGFPYSEHFLMTQFAFQNSKDPIEIRAQNTYFIAPGNDAARERLRGLLMASPQDYKHNDMPLPEKPVFPYVRDLRIPTLILIGSADIGRQPGRSRRSGHGNTRSCPRCDTRRRTPDVSGKARGLLFFGDRIPEIPWFLNDTPHSPNQKYTAALASVWSPIRKRGCTSRRQAFQNAAKTAGRAGLTSFPLTSRNGSARSVRRAVLATSGVPTARAFCEVLALSAVVAKIPSTACANSSNPVCGSAPRQPTRLAT
jgi:hypothetical protein